MKNIVKNWRSAAAIVGIIAMVRIPAAVAFGPDHAIFPPGESVFGLTYGDWSAAWWQYVLSISTSTNPNTDITGVNCGVGQSSGPVFFLMGAPTTDPIIRTCTVAGDKAVFFPIINTECSTVEPTPFLGANGQEARTCAAGFLDGVRTNTLKVTIDGKEVPSLGRYRMQSPFFDFIMPAADNFLALPGVTSGSSASDGYWLMLKPLSPGEHVIHFEGAIVSGPGAGFSQNITYHLTVTP